jgi:hypothetical protein
VGKAAAEDKDTTVSSFCGPHSNMRKEQRDIKFEDIEDAIVKGTVSLAIRFEGENGRVQVMDEISTWGGRIKEEPQFEGIAIGDANAKGRDGDRRMEVELQGSKEEGEEVDVEGIGLCSQCGIVIDKKSKDSTCCSFSHTWWSKGKMYAPGRDGKCKNCKRTGKDHRKTRRGKAVYNLCYHPDWAKGYDECCCNCAKDKGWSADGYEEYGCEQCKNMLRLVKASDGIANLVDITSGHQVDTRTNSKVQSLSQ